MQHPGVDAIPENYDERLTELSPGRFKNILLFIPDASDLALSKPSRNIERDRQDVKYLVRTAHLEPSILRERYVKELRSILIGDPRQHDQTLEFWIEAYFPQGLIGPLNDGISQTSRI